MVRLRVSSRHLILASPVFRRMLEGPWMESQACHGPLREISVGEWDLEAFIIVLDIIHGHHRLVPRSLSLEMLAKVAVIVNYYDCVEVVEVFSDNWLKELEKDPPKSYGRESILALLASWVFSAVDIFEQMTELAVRNSNCLIQAADLPIPGEILDSIDQSRQISVGRIFSALYTLLDSLTREEVGCFFECSSMILGSLTIQLNKHEILSPRATAPFSGYNVTAVQAIVYDIRRTTWYTGNSRSSYHSSYDLSVHSCNLLTHMEPTIAMVEGELKGLKLEDYQHSK
ncbi:hypothetical protein BKA56DRAFT_493469 [Ilyonectria sp. MPI-CAGE-AT-0026]|nr:hypothetical protein BKA56DRAFT_493469 [Ilyonectria sp. MPI-CAGE-AT-0026]